MVSPFCYAFQTIEHTPFLLPSEYAQHTIEAMFAMYTKPAHSCLVVHVSMHEYFTILNSGKSFFTILKIYRKPFESLDFLKLMGC